MIKNIKNTVDLSSFHIVFDGSTMNEKQGLFGISHLCEHLICKSIDHLQDDFQRYGIIWNAYTSNTEVVFYINGLDEYINKYKQEFLDCILSYIPTDAELKNEKKIVMEEYKDSFNDQVQSHYLNLVRKRYNYYTPIGLREDIENYTIEEVKEFINSYFKKPNQIINISKNNDNFESDIEFSETLISDVFKIQNQPNIHLIKSNDDLVVPDNHIPLELMNEYNNKTSVINLSPIITEDFPIVSFTCNMLGSGLNSPLYQEVREKSGLAYYIQCNNNRLNYQSSTIMIITETSNENVEQVQLEIKNVLDNKEKYLTQERFDIIKDNMIVRIKKNEILKHSSINKYLEPDVWSLEKIIFDLTLEDVYKVIDKYFIWDDFHHSIYNEEF